MAKEADLKKRAESVLGKELAADALERIRWTIRISSYDYTTDNAYVASTSLILPPSKWCNPHPLFDIGGVAATGSDGKQVFRLRDFSCVVEIIFEDPVNVVATPVSSEPFFLTLKHALVPHPTDPTLNDVEITVFAWDADGNAAPNIAFNWRCRVPYWERIL